MTGPRDELPQVGLVLWPVANGDSITLLLAKDVIMQVDLRHMGKAEDDADPHVAVIDALEAILPIGSDGKPYLSCFALTHTDLDHCQGFAELLDRVTIGELWLTPRIFRDNDDGELNEHAQAFCDEAMRRVEETIKAGGLPKASDRVRVIGWDELLEEDAFKGFPADLLTIPGTEITGFDGVDHTGTFRAFIHAPFHADSQGERNDTSLGMQVTLCGDRTLRAMLLGDLRAPTVKRIFCEATPDTDDLAWNIYVSPHHCSKGALFVEDESGEGVLDLELLECLAANAEDGAFVVASSNKFRDEDVVGDLPPHKVAREAYEQLVEEDHFLCTGEHGETENFEPIVFSADSVDALYAESRGSTLMKMAIGAAVIIGGKAIIDAVVRSRGSKAPPARSQGFGVTDKE
jgi:hypothetical protein